jgi:hypothetical protein
MTMARCEVNIQEVIFITVNRPDIAVAVGVELFAFFEKHIAKPFS